MNTKEANKTECYSREKYESRMQVFKDRWNKRRRKIWSYILLVYGLLFLVLGVVALAYSTALAEVLGIILLCASVLVAIGGACTDEGYGWAKSYRTTPSDPVVTLNKYYEALFMNFGKQNDAYMGEAYVCSIESALLNHPGFEDYGRSRRGDLERVYQDLSKCSPKPEENFCLRLFSIKPEIEKEEGNLKTYKITLSVSYWQWVNAGGIRTLKNFGEIQVVEQKTMSCLWDRWFVLNSQFSVGVN